MMDVMYDREGLLGLFLPLFSLLLLSTPTGRSSTMLLAAADNRRPAVTMLAKHVAVISALWASCASSQFVPAPSDLTTKEGYAGINVRYKQVPTGICEMDPDVKSFSGYADVAEDEHIFWYVRPPARPPARLPEQHQANESKVVL